MIIDKICRPCKNGLLLIAACTMMLSACSVTPRVVSNVTVKLPPKTADSIAIYEDGLSVPRSAQEIGKVKVFNGGRTPLYDCLYSNMLALAARKTAECGGNGLRIDLHKTPNIWTDPCHRVEGTMLLVPVSSIRQNTMTALQDIEQRKDGELLADMKQIKSQVSKMFDTPRNILKANIGIAWISSDYYVGTRNRKWKSAFDYTVEYQHLWHWIGLGVNFEHASFSFEEGAKCSNVCIGPDVILTIKSGQALRWEFSFGADYAFYTEKIPGFSSTVRRVCPHISMGGEYKLSDHLALGIQYDVNNFRMDPPEGVVLEKNESYGINWLHLFGGLRYYF